AIKTGISVLLRPTQGTWRRLRGKVVRGNYCLVSSPTNERRLGHQHRHGTAVLQQSDQLQQKRRGGLSLWPQTVAPGLVESENSMRSDAAEIEPRFARANSFQGPRRALTRYRNLPD